MPTDFGSLIDEYGDPIRGGSPGAVFAGPGPGGIRGGGVGGGYGGNANASPFGVRTDLGPDPGGAPVSPMALRRLMAARTLNPNIALPSMRPGGGAATPLPGRTVTPAPAGPVSNNPGNPDAWQQFLSSQGDIPDLNRLLTAIIGGQGGGAFGAYGDPHIMDLLRSEIQRAGGDRERAAVLGANLDAGDDPALAAYARTMARAGTAGETQDLLGKAQLSQAEQAQQMIQRLAELLFGSNLGIQRQNNAAINERYNQDAQRVNPIWQLLGSVAGGATQGYIGRGAKQ